MQIIIENLQNAVEFHEEIYETIKKAVEMSLKMEDFVTPSEISVLLVDDEKIREINLEQRNIDKPTDVLSFPMVDIIKGEITDSQGDIDLDENLLLLGDIIISLETAKRQSEEYGHSFLREVAFLTTHGVYHILGYDHMDEADEKEMMDKQELVLKEMGMFR